ncbi:MAG: alkaline phosphatase D family protein [Verrucomicrobiae bacterium]|nr:alkaline phosphatase D family protein [Verrucomicrobiae bacterium]
MKCAFLRIGWLGTLIFVQLCPTASASPTAQLDLGPMLGHVGPTEARIWVKAAPRLGGAKAARRSVAVCVSEHPDLSRGRTLRTQTLHGPEYLGQFHITGLKPATRYYYWVHVDGESGMASPAPSFVTAPAEGSRGRLRLAFISCVGRNAFDPAAAWGDLAARTPIDLLLFLGDNHYADTTEPAGQRAAYYVQRRLAGFRDLSRRVPCYGIWDDHDYGPNNSDGTAAGKERSLETFKEFWANPGYGQRDDPGVYFKFTRGDVDFFMLDVRYHRSPNAAPDDGNKTMLGAAQLAWLKRELLASKATVKFLASGSEWQSNGSEDSWSRFNRERMELFDFIQERGIPGVVLLSGDRHFTAAYQILGRLIEVTSGPFGSSNSTRAQPTPEAIYFVNTGKLYCVFEVDTTGVEPRLTLEVYRAAEGLIHKREFAWNEVLGVTKIPPLVSGGR